MIAVNRQEAETEDHACGPRRMLNEAQVLAIIPVGRTTLYRMEKTGRFPAACGSTSLARLSCGPSLCSKDRVAVIEAYTSRRGRS